MTYKITVEGTKIVATCDEDEPIAECLEMHDIYVDCDCRVGVCGTCKMMITDGTVDQEEQGVLDASEIDHGYILSCVAYPETDCTIRMLS